MANCCARFGAFAGGVGERVHDAGGVVHAGAQRVGGAIAYGATQIGQGVCWLGRNICIWVFHPIGQAAAQGWEYAKANKKAIATNIIAWGLILVFCGAIHGFKIVSLPMLIGIGPGLAIGCLGGMLAAKAFAHEQNGIGLFHTVQQEFDQIPEWPKTLLLALASSLYVLACIEIPYGTGVMAGLFLGGVFAYKATNFDPNRPPDPTQQEQIEALTEQQTGMTQDIEELRRQLHEQIRQLQEGAVDQGLARLQEQINHLRDHTVNPRLDRIQDQINQLRDETVTPELTQLREQSTRLHARIGQIERGQQAAARALGGDPPPGYHDAKS